MSSHHRLLTPPLPLSLPALHLNPLPPPLPLGLPALHRNPLPPPRLSAWEIAEAPPALNSAPPHAICLQAF